MENYYIYFARLFKKSADYYESFFKKENVRNEISLNVSETRLEYRINTFDTNESQVFSNSNDVRQKLIDEAILSIENIYKQKAGDDVTLESLQSNKVNESDTNNNVLLNTMREENELLRTQLAAEKKGKQILLDNFEQSRASSITKYQKIKSELSTVLEDTDSLKLKLQDYDTAIKNKDYLINRLTKNLSSAEERIKTQDEELFKMKNDVILLDAELNKYKDKQFYLDLQIKKDYEVRLTNDKLYDSLKIKYDELNKQVLDVKFSEIDRLTKNFNLKTESLEKIIAELTQHLTQRDKEMCEYVKQKTDIQSEYKILTESHSNLLTLFNAIKVQSNEQAKTIDLKNDTENSLYVELDTVKETIEMKDAEITILNLKIDELKNELSNLKIDQNFRELSNISQANEKSALSTTENEKYMSVENSNFRKGHKQSSDTSQKTRSETYIVVNPKLGSKKFKSNMELCPNVSCNKITVQQRHKWSIRPPFR